MIRAAFFYIEITFRLICFRMPSYPIFILSAVFLFLACQPSQTHFGLNPEVSASDVQKIVSFLADDSLKGRAAGSVEEAISARFISSQMEEMGLKPIVEKRFVQEFEFIAGAKERKEGSFLVVGEQTFSSDQNQVKPVANTPSAEVAGPLAFVGYAIDAPEASYDDFAGFDLDGSIALIFRFGPDGTDNPHSDFGSHWALKKKIELSARKGAVGALIVTGPLNREEDEFDEKRFDRMAAELPIPALQISLSTATQLAQNAGFSLSTAQQKIDRSKRPQSRLSKLNVLINANVEQDKRVARNVAGMIRGQSQPDRFIVFGAHFDHLGMGEYGSLYRGERAKIHNGADDNASGTAGLLELAHHYATHPPEYSMLFVAFSAEELGLLGSEYFVEHTPIDLISIEAMINMDMIGRLTDKKLQVFGVGSSPQWEELITQNNLDTLDITLTPDGVGASDHTSFYTRDISVLHYFTGTHADYHRPSDDADYINAEGTVEVVRHIIRVADGIQNMGSEQFTFSKAPSTQRRNVTMTGITLGVLPDYGFSGLGMKITGITEGRLGDKLGMQAGDVIIDLAGSEIKDIYDYMEALNSIKKGNRLTAVVKRENERLTLQTTVD